MKIIIIYLLLLSAFFFHSMPLYSQSDTPTAKSFPEMFLCISDTLEKCSTIKNFLCEEECLVKQNSFNYVLAKNCYFRDKKSGRAITPKYITVYDRRDESLTYFKLKNEKGFEYLKVKKVLRPRANREMYFIVVSQDTGYSLKVGSEEYFLEYEEAFAKSIKKAGGDKNAQVSTDSLETNDEKSDLIESSKIGVSLKLQSLEDALIVLNSRYPSKTIIDESYFFDLSCLRIKISEQFSFSIEVQDTVTFAENIKESQDLTDKLLVFLSGKGTLSDSVKIGSIRSKYLVFINKQLNSYNLFATQIQIPDKDVFKFNVEHDKKDILSRDFRVSRGFKIDFSAGVFLTGLAVPEFLTKEHSFKYKKTVTAIDTTTGELITTFTGSVADTTGSLIHEKNPKMNYAAGFLSHAYVRTGRFMNMGLSTGVLVNNDGFQMLLGSSLLLSIRKSRIGLSGGLAIGKQKTISSTASNSLWEDSREKAEILNSASDLPMFINTTDVPVFDKWKTSWFVGLTYNFNSASIP